jgi:hypothetical protein
VLGSCRARFNYLLEFQISYESAGSFAPLGESPVRCGTFGQRSLPLIHAFPVPFCAVSQLLQENKRRFLLRPALFRKVLAPESSKEGHLTLHLDASRSSNLLVPRFSSGSVPATRGIIVDFDSGKEADIR